MTVNPDQAHGLVLMAAAAAPAVLMLLSMLMMVAAMVLPILIAVLVMMAAMVLPILLAVLVVMTAMVLPVLLAVFMVMATAVMVFTVLTGAMTVRMDMTMGLFLCAGFTHIFHTYQKGQGLAGKRMIAIHHYSSILNFLNHHPDAAACSVSLKHSA